MLDFITAIGQNIALLFSLIFIYSLIWPRLKLLNPRLSRLTIGVLFGLISVFAMLNPIPLGPGVFTDGRDIIIMLAGLTEGTGTALVAGVITMIARWTRGGVGVYAGMGVVLSAILVSWLARRALNAPISRAKPRFFIIFGIILSLVGRLWVLTLPDKQLALTIIKTTTAPLMVLSILQTLMLGQLLAREVRHQEMEAALHESENRFVKAFRASPVATIISTLQEGIFVDVNESFLKLIGFARHEVIGQKKPDLNIWVQPEDRGRVVESLIHNETVYHQETQFRKKTGELVDVLLSAERIELGGTPHLLSLIYDITDRKRFERALQKLNEELESRVQERTAALHREQLTLKTILDSMGEGVIYSSDLMVRYINPALEALCGYSAAELIGQPNDILKPDTLAPDQPFIPSETAIGPDETWLGETQFRHKQGHNPQVALTVRRLAEFMPGVGGTVTVIRDITEEKELEEQKARFIANASHELRTPLTNLATRLYLLRNQSDKLEEHLSVIERVTRQMSGLVEDLLEIARFEQGTVSLKMADIKLQDLIADVISIQQAEADKKAISLAAELPATPVHTQGDFSRLNQVVTNLLVNAIHYTPEGGRITVLLDQMNQQSSQVAKLAVKDTGIGIRMENLHRIFEPFFRANDGPWRGTGLGLSIAKEIVEQHGGSLSVESVVGTGSTFTIYLPLTQTA